MRAGLSAINRKLLRDFWSLRGQAAAIALVIAGGVTTWIISFSTIASLEQTQDAFYREYRFAEVFATLKRAPERLLDRIGDIPGVRSVQARTMAAATLEVGDFPDPITGHFVSLPDDADAALNRVYLRRGRLPASGAADEVVVSEPFVEAHGLDLGATFTAVINGRRQRLALVGIGLSPEFIYQIRPGELFPDYRRYAIVWMNEEPLAAAWGTENAFNNLVLTLDKGAQEADVIDRVDSLLEPYGGTGAHGRDQQLSHRYLSEELRGLRASASVVPFLFLGVAAFLLNVVVSRIVTQQRDQIAVLKAFGYTNRQVGLHYVGLVALVCAAGAALGIAVGAWLGHGLASLYAHFYRFPFLHYTLPSDVIVGGVAVAFGAALIGTLRAVGGAVALPPAEAMRPEPPANYRPTLVERLGMQRLFDQPTRMVLRHLERRAAKSLLSVLGISLGGAILMVGAFQGDAIDYMIDVQFNLAQREDLTVAFVEPASREALFELQSLPGVYHAEPFRAVPATLRAGHRSYRTVVQGFENDGDLHRPLDMNLAPIRLPENGLLITDHLGTRLGVKVGDTLVVEVLEGAQPVREVQVAGLVKEYIGLSAYMEIDGLNRLMQEGPLISGAYLAADRARRNALFDALEARPRIAGTSIREVAIDTFYETMGETILVFAFVNTLLAGSIAFGVVYNSARIGLSEHARELASLRILGFTRGEVSYILLGELAMLTLTAIPLGFGIGYAFSWLIAESFTSELYRIPLVVEPSTYGLSAGVVLAAALISGFIVRNKVYALDLVAVLKTRE